MQISRNICFSLHKEVILSSLIEKDRSSYVVKWFLNSSQTETTGSFHKSKSR